jgi:hypothetical protein
MQSLRKVPSTWIERSSCSRRDDQLTTHAQVLGTEHRGSIFVQPASGFQVDSVHAMAVLALMAERFTKRDWQPLVRDLPAYATIFRLVFALRRMLFRADRLR